MGKERKMIIAKNTGTLVLAAILVLAIAIKPSRAWRDRRREPHGNQEFLIDLY